MGGSEWNDDETPEGGPQSGTGKLRQEVAEVEAAELVEDAALLVR